MRSVRTLCLSLACLLAAGCSTTLSTLQTADTVPVKHVDLTVGAGVYIPAGSAARLASVAIDTGKSLKSAAKAGTAPIFTEQQKQDALSAGIGLAVLPPAMVTELSLRTGLFDNVDVGLRYSVTAMGLDAKWRFFHGENGNQRTDLALAPRASRFLFKGPIFDALDYVKLGDFSRWDFELPLIYSWAYGDFFRFYAAPKYVFTKFSFDETLYDIAQETGAIGGVSQVLPGVSAPMHFFGGSLGIGAGYKYAFILLELTGGYTRLRPTVLGQERDLGGVTLYPALGLDVKI